VSPTALERLALFFGTLRTRPGILGRKVLGTPDPADRGLALELAVRLTTEIRPDGSVSGGAVPTIWCGHELLDLGVRSYDPALKRLCAWLFERQGRPGAYGEGCDKARHQQRVCEHYVQGFFSPAAPEQRLAPITLPNGKVFRAEPAARFAISCLGLRLVLRAGHGDRPAVAKHLESLRLLAPHWHSWTGFFAPDVMVAGLHALAVVSACSLVKGSRQIAQAPRSERSRGERSRKRPVNGVSCNDSAEASAGARSSVPPIAMRRRRWLSME